MQIPIDSDSRTATHTAGYESRNIMSCSASLAYVHARAQHNARAGWRCRTARHAARRGTRCGSPVHEHRVACALAAALWPQHCGRSSAAPRACTDAVAPGDAMVARAAGRHGGDGSGDGSSRGSTCVAMGDDTGGGAGDGGGSSTAVAVKATTCTTATCTGTTISDARTVGAERSRPCSHTSLRKLSSDAKRMITTQRRRQTVAGDLRRCGHWNTM